MTSSQLTDLTYDFSHLSADYAFSNGNSHFMLHVCGPLTKSCGDNTRSGACEVVNGNYLSLGKWWNYYLPRPDDPCLICTMQFLKIILSNNELSIFIQKYLQKSLYYFESF